MTLVSDLLNGIGGGVELINEQNFTTTGTWNKPAIADPDDLAEIILWGAGGGAIDTAKAGGGACNRQFVRVRDLPSSVSAIVAAASIVTSGPVDGATSEFWKFKAYGGAGANSTSRGAGGGILGPPASFRGGPPTGGYTDGDFRQTPGKWGGGGGNDVSWGVKHSEYGGAGGEGNSIWGGAGGDGTSIYGGNGATNSTDAQAPGGGGKFGGGLANSRRNGARGEIRVKIWRGI